VYEEAPAYYINITIVEDISGASLTIKIKKVKYGIDKTTA
jgi:hypothetical protein